MKALLPDQIRISQVHLRTANLDRALTFYTEVLGLTVAREGSSRAVLSSATHGPTLIVLTEEPDAPPRPPRTTGLYHFALRYPSRQALAQAYRQIVRSGYPVVGASDHDVSEAIYLTDPEGNGVELYADRPRALWAWRDGQVAMTTRALDLDALLGSIRNESTTAEPAPQIDIGHIHLHVADLAAAERFYGEYLGFAVTQRSYPGALFFAAGGYHHHVGVNTWAGQIAPPAGSVGLISYRFEVPVAEMLYCLDHRAPLQGYEARPEIESGGRPILQILDPNGNWLEVQPSPTAISIDPASLCAADHETNQTSTSSATIHVEAGARRSRRFTAQESSGATQFAGVKRHERRAPA
jgi:catechol 2,3-dioxygenase